MIAKLLGELGHAVSEALYVVVPTATQQTQVVAHVLHAFAQIVQRFVAAFALRDCEGPPGPPV